MNDFTFNKSSHYTPQHYGYQPKPVQPLRPEPIEQVATEPEPEIDPSPIVAAPEPTQEKPERVKSHTGTILVLSIICGFLFGIIIGFASAFFFITYTPKRSTSIDFTVPVEEEENVEEELDDELEEEIMEEIKQEETSRDSKTTQTSTTKKTSSGQSQPEQKTDTYSIVYTPIDQFTNAIGFLSVYKNGVKIDFKDISFSDGTEVCDSSNTSANRAELSHHSSYVVTLPDGTKVNSGIKL